MIESNEALVPIVTRLCAEGFAALDTEFVWTRTYYPRLGVVQLGALDGSSWVVDAVAAGDALAALLGDAETVKILHDAQQDLTLLARETGARPRHVFDTQLAAGFAGLTSKISLKQLLKDVLDVDLPKMETRTDWCQRPLSSSQIEYALDDVRYLGRLREALIARADQLGTTAWLEEEMQRYDNAELYAQPEPETAWQRVKGMKRLPAQERPLLRELAAIRERLAITWDLPRNWVTDDASLLKIIDQKPSSSHELHLRHRLNRTRLQELREAICAAVQAARQKTAPVDNSIQFRNRLNREQKQEVDDALSFLHQRAKVLNVDAALLASRADLTGFVLYGVKSKVPLTHGWRYEVIGRELAERLVAARPLELS